MITNPFRDGSEQHSSSTITTTRTTTTTSSSSLSSQEDLADAGPASALTQPLANGQGIHRQESATPPLALKQRTDAAAAEHVDPKVVKRGKLMVATQKHLMILFLTSVNFILIFASWFWPKYFYVYMPFISLPLLLNSCMIVNVTLASIKNRVFPPEKTVPTKPESMILLMPCYNETLQECTRSLDSLVSQTGVEKHQKAIFIVCDGRVRGEGMPKTTADHLKEDILAAPGTQSFTIRAAYIAWDGQSMDVEIVKGIYKNVPFYCVLKQQNQGKRDSLIVSRSFVYNYNLRDEIRAVVFAPDFFASMADWALNDAGMDRIDVLIGMDADTVFDDDCISHLVTESHYPKTVGVCGYVAVDYLHGNWNMWSIYQSTEYTIAQALRRLHQSIVTHKVSCLPGCCQLLKVCEETCGDKILIELFGYHPVPTDGLIRRIRATASEDRNHVCLMLMNFPHAQTRQALRARAYTDVPHSASVFLSQRRRWTLGATSNDLMLFARANWWHFNWWERLVAFSNVLTWCLNPFVIASLACMVNAFIHQPFWLVLVFASIMIIPLCYYISVSVWLPRNWTERGQYLLGLFIFTTCGPFINIVVTMYAAFNMSNFGWGKTRKVVAEAGDAEEPLADEQQQRLQAAADDHEKITGTLVSDLENQVAGGHLRTPYTTIPARVRVRNVLI